MNVYCALLLDVVVEEYVCLIKKKKRKHEGSRAFEAIAFIASFPFPRVLSPFRPADVRGSPRTEEPHGPARRKLLGQGQGQGRWNQLHHRGLEGVHVQHLALGADSQVSSAPQHHRHVECVFFSLLFLFAHTHPYVWRSQTESQCSFMNNAYSKPAEEKIEKSICGTGKASFFTTSWPHQILEWLTVQTCKSWYTRLSNFFT